MDLSGLRGTSPGGAPIPGVAVIGAGGQLGTAFVRLLGPDVAALTRADLDLTDLAAIPRILDETDPSVLINCAGYTNVDRAESEEDLATVVNGEAVGEMSEWCSKHNVSFVTFSTDYVFNGEAERPYVESSPTDPINAYGRSKLVGEELALEHEALVVRTSWVLSGSHPNFVATMIRLAAQPLTVVDDQVGCPTVTTDLARATLDALDQGVTGLLHLTNTGPTTWFRLAQSAILAAGLSTDQLSSCTTAEYPTPAVRPGYSVLESERISGLGIDPLPAWEDSLPGVVAEIMTWI